MQKDDDVGSWWCHDTLNHWAVVDEKYFEDDCFENHISNFFWSSTVKKYECKEFIFSDSHETLFGNDSQEDTAKISFEDFEDQDICTLLIKKLKRMLQPKKNISEDLEPFNNKFDFLLYCSNNNKMKDNFCFNTSTFVYTCQTESKNEKSEGTRSPKYTVSINSCDPLTPNEVTIKMRTTSNGFQPVADCGSENLPPSQNSNPQQQEGQPSLSREHYRKLSANKPCKDKAETEVCRSQVINESLRTPDSELRKNPNNSDSCRYTAEESSRKPALQEPVRYVISVEPTGQPGRFVAVQETDRFQSVHDNFKYSATCQSDQCTHAYAPIRHQVMQEPYKSPITNSYRYQIIEEPFKSPVAESYRQQVVLGPYRSSVAEPCRSSNLTDHHRYPVSPEPYRSSNLTDSYRYPVSPEPYRSSNLTDPYRYPISPEPYRSSNRTDPYRYPVSPEPYRSSNPTDPYRYPVSPEPYRSSNLTDHHRYPVSPEPYRSSNPTDPYRYPVSPEPYRSSNLTDQHRYPVSPEPYRSSNLTDPYRYPVSTEPSRSSNVTDRYQCTVSPERYESPAVTEPHKKTVGTQAETNFFHNVFYAPIRHCSEKCKRWFLDEEDFYSSRNSTESEAAYNIDNSGLPFDINIYNTKDGYQDIAFGSAISASEESDLPFQEVEDSYRTAPDKSNNEDKTSCPVNEEPVNEKQAADSVIKVECDGKVLQTNNSSPMDAHTIKITCSPRGVENLIIPFTLKTESAQLKPSAHQESICSSTKEEVTARSDSFTADQNQEEKPLTSMKSELCQCSIKCDLVDRSSQTRRDTEDEAKTCYLDCVENKRSESTMPTCIFVASSESYASESDSAASPEEKIPVKKSSSPLKIDPCIKIGGMWSIQNKSSNESAGKKGTKSKNRKRNRCQSGWPLRFSLQPFENASSAESQVKTYSETNTKNSDEDDFYSLAWGYKPNRKSDYKQDLGFSVYEVGVFDCQKPDKKFKSLESCNDGEQWILDMRKDDVDITVCPLQKRQHNEETGRMKRQDSSTPVERKSQSHKKCQTKFKCIKYVPCRSKTKSDVCHSMGRSCNTNKTTHKCRKKESDICCAKKDKGVLVDFQSDDSNDKCRPSCPQRYNKKKECFKKRIYICKKVQTDDNSNEDSKVSKIRLNKKQNVPCESLNSSSDVSISDDDKTCNPEYIQMLSRMYCSLAPESCQFPVCFEDSSGKNCNRKCEKDIHSDILSAFKKLIKPNQLRGQRAGDDQTRYLIPEEPRWTTNKNINPNIWNYINQIISECSIDTDTKESYYDEIDIERPSQTVL